MDAFRLVTDDIDRAEHLLRVDCIVQNDPAMTIARFHHLEHQARTRSPAALPSGGTVCLHAAGRP